MLNRRQLLVTTAAAAGASAFPALAAEGSELDRLFDQLFQEGLRQRPESATQLGLDKGANADLRGRLSDESDKGRAAAKALNVDQIRRLKAIDRAKLGATDRINYDLSLIHI